MPTHNTPAFTGDSAIGKSELALELISRGNGLIADDIVELYRISPDTLEGRCPGVLRDFLEVRDWALTEGRNFTEAEERSAAKVIILGATTARELFADEPVIDQQVRVIACLLTNSPWRSRCDKRIGSYRRSDVYPFVEILRQDQVPEAVYSGS